MALTFLQAMNETLKQVGIIQGDAGELTTFTDSARQTDIDIMIQSWNLAVSELYKFKALPKEIASGTITLVTGTREYDLASDFEGFIESEQRSTLTDETNGYRIYHYPGGFAQMVYEQLQPSNYEGQPVYYVINPTNGKIRLDTAPTAEENGNIYTYYYTKSIGLSLVTDTFPFSDTVVELMYFPVVQLWNSERKEIFDAGKFSGAMANATRALNPHEISRMY